MIQKEASAQVPEKKDLEGKIAQQALGPASIVINYPESFEEANEMFGEEAVLSNAFANWKVVLQSGIRSALKSGLTPDQIQAKLGSSVMGVAQVGGKVNIVDSFAAKFAMSTPEKQAELLDMLRERAAV